MKASVNPERTLFSRDIMIYGHFLEHFHRQIYGGVYDPGNPLSDGDGFRTDARDTYTISYVGYQDWGGMAEYIRSVHTITDGNLMLEVNALPDKFCVTFHKVNKDRKALDLFCKAMEEAGLKYRVSECRTRYLPEIRLPK